MRSGGDGGEKQKREKKWRRDKRQNSLAESRIKKSEKQVKIGDMTKIDGT